MTTSEAEKTKNEVRAGQVWRNANNGELRLVTQVDEHGAYSIPLYPQFVGSGIWDGCMELAADDMHSWRER